MCRKIPQTWKFLPKLLTSYLRKRPEAFLKFLEESSTSPDEHMFLAIFVR